MPPNGRKGPPASGPPLKNVDFAGLDIERIPRQSHRKQPRPKGPGELARRAELRRRVPSLRVIEGARP